MFFLFFFRLRVLVFIAIVVLYACVLNRADRRSAQPPTEVRAGVGAD